MSPTTKKIKMSKGVVNCWNEWDPLREVVVGTLEGKVFDPPKETAVVSKGTMRKVAPATLSANPDDYDHVNDVHDRVNKYIEMFKGEGIEVKRPSIFDFHQSVKTPTFESATQAGNTCPRDLFFVVGEHLIEAPMSWKCRQFEHLGYRDMMMTYMQTNPRMRWSCAPKPRLLDSTFAFDAESSSPGAPTITNTEILFDAADARRFGKDVFVQTCHTANQLGLDWIRRTLAPDGVRVHHFDLEQNLFVHLDGKVCPTDDHTFWYTNADAPSQKQLALFKENEWNVIEVDARESCVSRGDMTGNGIHLNTFNLAPGKTVVEANEKKLIKKMREEGVDVIPMDYSVCYQWGGGLNCWTLDMVRDGSMTSHFPTFDVEEERKLARESTQSTADNTLADN